MFLTTNVTVLDQIGNFFNSFGQTLSSIGDFIVSLFEDISLVIQVVAKVIAEIPFYFAWLPIPGLVLLITILSVVSLYLIIGRK